MNHVFKIIIIIMIIIIIIIIIIKEKYKSQTGGRRRRERKKACRGDFLFFIISSFCLFLRSMKIGPSVFVGDEGKVDLQNESYVRTPKSWSFVKLHEVGIFSYYVILWLRAM